MIEDAIKTHLTDCAMTAFPTLSQENVIVSVPSGTFDYTKNKGRSCIGTETLLAEVVVDSADRVDRRDFIRTVGRQEIDFGDGYRAFQSYQRHISDDYTTVSGLKRTVFYLNYTYDIYEETE